MQKQESCDKSSGDNLIFLGPVFFHWDASYFTFNTFFSHVKALLDSNVQCIDIRIGSDDEGGLTKAIDNVFPNATRLLCSKHIKDNVTDHIKNKLPITKDQCSDIMSNLFGTMVSSMQTTPPISTLDPKILAAVSQCLRTTLTPS